ncbi:unnamed protein product [Symbiodinium sp. KB8]|nr:unnamed protein product [Symbiodinium sp. KB8]
MEPTMQAAQEVADILQAAVATINPPSREDEEMPPTSALGKRAEHRTAEGPAKFSKPAGKGQGQGSHHPPEPEPSRGSGQSSDQWQDRPANPKNWTKEQTRQRQDDMWRQWESNTSWYQAQDIKKLRQEMEQLQEHVRLLARMSLRYEDELSQGRAERGFVLTFEPPTPGTNEKKEEGKMDSSLRLVLFLGLTKQYIKQITTSLEQPEDREQLAMMKFLRQTNEGRSMEWPYLRWNQERQLLEEAPMAAHGPDDGPGYTGKLYHGARGPPAFSLYTQAGGKSPVLAEHFPPPEMAMGRGKQGKGQVEPAAPEAVEAKEKESAETTTS